MLFTKYFGIYHTSEFAADVPKYMGIRDMSSNECKATENSVNSYSTSDHVVGKNIVLC